MKKLVQLSLLSLFALSLTACSKVSNLYNNYINPPTEMNYNILYDIQNKEDQLSVNLLSISEELASFQKDFDLLVQPPVAEQLDLFFQKYSWLTGIILIRPNGEPVVAVPDFFPAFDFQTILHLPKKADERAIRAYFMNSHIVIAKPVFDNTNEFLGLTLLYFDYNNLVDFVGDIDKEIITIAANDGIIISANDFPSSYITEKNWQKLVKKNSRGTISEKPEKAHWITRYIYDYPLVFLIEEK